MKKNGYDVDDETFKADAYKVDGWGEGIAWRVLGWETEPDEDTEWTGFEVKTGKVLVYMVGADQRFAVDQDDITPIAREEYCGECGQMGCGHDGLDRS